MNFIKLGLLFQKIFILICHCSSDCDKCPASMFSHLCSL